MVWVVFLSIAKSQSKQKVPWRQETVQCGFYCAEHMSLWVCAGTCFTLSEYGRTAVSRPRTVTTFWTHNFSWWLKLKSKAKIENTHSKRQGMFVNLETLSFLQNSKNGHIHCWNKSHILQASSIRSYVTIQCINRVSAERGGAGRGEDGRSPRRALPGGGTIRRWSSQTLTPNVLARHDNPRLF